MNVRLPRIAPVILLAAFACDASVPPPPSQQQPPAGYSQAPPPGAQDQADPEIQQTVARISYVTGGVSFSRGDDPDDWQPADLNLPMTLGDRVWTGDDGQIELQVHGGSIVRLAARTDLQALNLTDSMKQFSLSTGTASFQVRRLGDEEVFEVDTPNSAITLERPGDYRIDVDADGNSRVQVRRGRAIAAAGGGQVALSAGDEMDIDGIDAPRYDIVAVPRPDGWDQWVEGRDRQLAQAHSYTYVTADIAGVEDLDQYGKWQQIPEYGWTWSPVSVAVGWAPYRAGRWIWQDPWGWTWVAAEPWGWAPYHYGRWVVYGSRWCWVPTGPSVRAVSYSPALVAFVGGAGGGYVGWFPLAPRDPYAPWWRRGTNVSVNVTYVNRTYVTVVNQTNFVSGRVLTRDYVQDRAVIRTVETAPVLRGPINVVPTRESIRGVPRQAAAVRPPAPAATRSVVVRVAPPPPPPRFDAKVAVIRDNRGAPVAPQEAARISQQSNVRPVTQVRPVAAGQAGVTLVPKNDNSRAAHPPEPVAPVRSLPATGAPAVAPSPRQAAPTTERVQQRPTPAPERARPTERVPQPQAQPQQERVTQPPVQRPTAARPPDRQERQTHGRPTPRPEAEVEATPVARPTSGRPPDSREQRQAPPNMRPTPAAKPEDRQRPTARPEPERNAAPERSTSERQAAPPPAREQAQPAERVAPTANPAQRQRQPARPVPTKAPTKKPD